MSDLLKQAIADAKAVRATALANAKAALEEAFTPKLQSMLAAKLQQEVNDADADDAVAPAPVTDEVPVADAPEAPVSLEPSAETVPDQVVAPDSEVPAAPVAPVEPDGDEESLEEYQPLGAGNPDSVEQNTNLTETDKASPDYKKTTSGAKTDDKGLEVVKAVSLSTAGEPKEKTAGKVTIKREVAPITKDVQGASHEVSKGAKKSDTSGTAALEEEIGGDDESLDEILRELESEVNQDTDLSTGECVSDVGAAAPAATVANDGDEEINLSELMEDDDKDADDKKSDDDDKDDDKEDRGNKLPWMKENAALKTELQEYRSAVKFLRDRINEVNLLNAKLLYTNKLFKQASLTNEQKMKVIESFDLTKSVREAKIVYATLSESFNFGGKKTLPVVAPKKAAPSTVARITEGLASKTVASTKPTKEILSEGTEMASRFKKLAGIRK